MRIAGTLATVLFVLSLLFPAAAVGEEEASTSEESTSTEADFFSNPFGDNDESDEDSEVSVDLFANPFGDADENEDEPEDSADLFSNPFGDADENDDSEDSSDLFSDPFATATADDSIDDGSEEGNATGINIDSSDLDSLFGKEIIEEAPEEDASLDLTASLLESEQLLWNGSYSASLGGSVGWDDYLGESILRTPDSDSVTTETSGTLRFNARPDTDFRVSGKLSLSAAGGFDLAGIDTSNISFGTDDEGNFVIGQDTPEDEDDEEEVREIPDQSQVTLNLGVEELFSDFNYNNQLFFRFGKAFIKWGKGYFWSPADILNINTINAEDPTAERQGPVNLKTNYPVGINNLNMYLLVDGVSVIEHVGIASNFEFVTGDFELGLGGYYKYDEAPRLVSAFSGSVGKIGLFGEGVVSFGSDRVFVRESFDQPTFAEPEPGEEDPTTYVALDTFSVQGFLPFFSGTLGAMYMNSELNLNIIGQYYFNGEGYAKNTRFPDGTTLLDNAAYLFNNPDTNGLALPADEQGDDYEEPLALGATDISNFGQHYAGLSVSVSEIFNTDLGFSIFWLANLTDMSGIISPSLSYRLFNRASVGLSARMTYGEAGDEYTNPQALFAQNAEDSPQTPTMEFSLTFSLGGGSF